MKGTLKWVLIGGGSFVILVGLIFVVLMIFEPSPEAPSVPEEKIATVTGDENQNADPQNSDQTDATDQEDGSNSKANPSELDSLQNLVQNLQSDIFASSVMTDSLKDVITFQGNLIDGYKKNIDDLNGQVLEREKQTVSLKELAKTYESMKVADIKPILKNMDDATVIAIYKAMGSRTRKSIMMALTAQRAAVITEILAGFTPPGEES